MEANWDKRLGGSDADGFETNVSDSLRRLFIGWIFAFKNLQISQRIQEGKLTLDCQDRCQWKQNWDKTYGGTGDDWGTTLVPTKDGGFLLTGSSEPNATGDKRKTVETILVTGQLESTPTGLKSGTRHLVQMETNGIPRQLKRMMVTLY